LTGELKERCIKEAKSIGYEFQGSTPPFDIGRVLRRFDIHEVRERPIDRDARLVLHDGRLVVELNPLFPKTRRRLSIAHEIGHSLINQCSGKDLLCTDHNDPAAESLCNRLAGELLAPDWAIRKYFEENQGLDSWQESVRCFTLLTAAKAFELSVDAITCRALHDLALAPRSVGLLWRVLRNSNRPESTPVLRITSAWHSIKNFGFIPMNKTAPPNSVITDALSENRVLARAEELQLGALKGQFLVEAIGFGSHAYLRSVLSLVCVS